MKQILTGLMAAAVLVTFSAPSFAMMDQKKKDESKGGHVVMLEEKKKEGSKGGHLFEEKKKEGSKGGHLFGEKKEEKGK